MGRRYGVTDRTAQNRKYDARRRAESPARKWYKTAAWAIRRRDQLANYPTCLFCEKNGITRIATVADHNPRHNGDWHQFFCGPLISICKPCHDSVKQSEESLGYSADVGADGWPTDPKNPFHQGVKSPSRQGAASKGARARPTAE
jgi:5-methylcytosine-specific restriction protein A